jgi:hypothetical protein
VPSISAITSPLIQPTPAFGRPEAVPAPPPDVGKRPNEFLFRRALPKGEPTEEAARRAGSRQKQTATKSRSEKAEAPQRRERGGDRRGRGAEVTAFQSYESFSPQFLTQFIAQVLVPESEVPVVANTGTSLYQDTETRANPDIVFGPVGPFSAIA